MENKRPRYKIQRNDKDYISCVEKIIKHQENLFNLTFRNGRWIRRYDNGLKKNKKVNKKNDVSKPIVRTKRPR